MPIERWKIELSNDCNVTLDDVKFIYSQAEKRLDDTIKTGETIASKTTTILTLMTGVIVGVSAYMFIPVKLSNPFRGNVTNPFRTKLYTR